MECEDVECSDIQPTKPFLETPCVSSQVGMKQLQLTSTTLGVTLCQPIMKEVNVPTCISSACQNLHSYKFTTKSKNNVV